MRMYDGAMEQLQGEDGDFTMQERNFEIALFASEDKVEFDREHKTVDQVLSSRRGDDKKKLDDLRTMTLDADLRVKYNEPNQRQILFLIQNRNAYQEEVEKHQGGALLYELEPTEPALPNLEEPKTYDERIGSESVGSTLVDQEDGKGDKSKKDEPVAATTAAPAKKRKRGGASYPAVIAMLSKADLISLANGEGLICTVPA